LGKTMAAILIKDLPESVELDAQAMTTIAGGARSGSHRAVRARAPADSTMIVRFPANEIAVVPQAEVEPARRGKVRK
jgi:hypothetical protein